MFPFFDDPRFKKIRFARVIKERITGKIRCSCYRGVDCEAKGKHPISKSEPLEVVHDYNGYNWQVVLPSELIVLDIDNLDAFNVFMQEYDLPQLYTPTVRTNRGLHLYFRTSIPLADTKIFTGIELKTRVNIPPSITSSGKPYEWIIPFDWDELAELPQAIADIANPAGVHHNCYELSSAPIYCSPEHFMEIKRGIYAIDPDLSYHDWFNVCRLLHSTGYAEEALELFIQWSSGAVEKWKGSETEKLARKTFLSLRYSYSTTFLQLSDYGVKLTNYFDNLLKL